jgi:hypothetical protein
LRDAVLEAVLTDQVIDQVGALIRAIGTGEMGSNNLMQALGFSHRPTFRNNYLNPVLEDEWIEHTQPDSPHSPTQCYRLTGKGRRWLHHHADEWQRETCDMACDNRAVAYQFDEDAHKGIVLVWGN